MAGLRAGCIGDGSARQGYPSQKGHWQLDKGSDESYSHSQHPLAWARVHPAPEKTQDRSVTCICVPQVHQDAEPSSEDEADPMRVQCLLHSGQSL